MYFFAKDQSFIKINISLYYVTNATLWKGMETVLVFIGCLVRCWKFLSCVPFLCQAARTATLTNQRYEQCIFAWAFRKRFRTLQWLRLLLFLPLVSWATSMNISFYFALHFFLKEETWREWVMINVDFLDVLYLWRGLYHNTFVGKRLCTLLMVFQPCLVRLRNEDNTSWHISCMDITRRF